MVGKVIHGEVEDIVAISVWIGCHPNGEFGMKKGLSPKDHVLKCGFPEKNNSMCPMRCIW